MGRPRMIIIIRHAQSEGNQNRQIHQTVPDHRVKLTSEGWQQAHEAGRQLRTLLKPSDTLQFYTSPYRRTRETTDGILQTLTAEDPDPSPFPRSSIVVREEPRIREQDFGNFQPNSADMETMWKERADYGHFFYRIPNGESAADAYDRVSGFNETLFRSFQEDDFPSVCVLVTHGLMTRVFLMRWYHWSVEYFEDLRNVNHCEMVVMNRNRDGGKFRLETPLRTWTELKRQRAIERGEDVGNQKKAEPTSPATVPVRRAWNAQHQDSVSAEGMSGPKAATDETRSSNTTATQKQPAAPISNIKAFSHPRLDGDSSGQVLVSYQSSEDDEEAFPSVRSAAATSSDRNTLEVPMKSQQEKLVERRKSAEQLDRPLTFLSHPNASRGFRGSPSGAATPVETDETSVPESNYFGSRQDQDPPSARHGWDEERKFKRDGDATPSEEDKKRWTKESGMGKGARAERLGDTRLDSDSEGANLSDQERADKRVKHSVY